MAVAEQSISLKTRRKTEVRIVLGWHRRDRAFLSVKSTAGKIITAPLRRVVGKIIDKSVNADRNPGRCNLYEDTKILRRLERAEINNKTV